ncbi:hypothetical protein BGZ97_011284 [Linnemannia gamsii]|uniref:Uncharacterized protein n=1 Tax=Linnemannia gamsii TaxID=64522 RepID=A0A9P6UN86_9FUNG|nr:hypothetical protein BGZ97_011284 [Linnemannia gamsii]
MVYNMAYATNDESTLYIQGGFDGTNSNYSTRFNQFYSLDLTHSWNTSYPLWSEMTAVGHIPDGLSTAGHTMSISHQNQSSSGPSNVTVWEMVNPLTFAASYKFDTKSWEELPTLPPPEPGPLRFYQAAVDPATDQQQQQYGLRAPDAGLGERYQLEWQSYGSIPPHLSEMCMVSVLVALVRIYRENSVRKGQGQGKDMGEKGFPLAPDDQKIEEGGTADEYFGNFESQAASGNTAHNVDLASEPERWKP